MPLDDERYEMQEGGIWVPSGAATEPPAAEAAAEPQPEPEPEPAAEPSEEIDYRDRYLRLLAENENVRRRTQQRIEHEQRRAREDLAERLLPLADGFVRAAQALEESASVEAVREGLGLLAGQLNSILRDWGVEPIPCQVGDLFDPELHEAVMRTDPTEEVPEHHIASVLETGFRLGGRVLRHAKVVVAGPPLDTQAD